MFVMRKPEKFNPKKLHREFVRSIKRIEEFERQSEEASRKSRLRVRKP